tara:strand:- start:351 stop:527 length:177 start_codon:yes stop_codon:yes gene_type:complete
MKKSESEDESELKTNVLIHHKRIKELERLVQALIGEVEAMQRGDNTGEKHKNDGGWFD